ncbi:MAG TPA: DUF2339 domain-containing protein, partial [Gemmatimonadaceae bacterium]|nr:DUF2339 domain-containing protein [Gemmatimonadaceae bacterium]
MADPERIEELEAAVRQLRQEMAELRAAVYERPATPTPGVRHVATAPARPSAAGARAPTAGAASPAPGRSRTGSPLDLEALVGRYGTIALATLTIIVGAGAFLTWAIENGLLGPRVRLALGAVAAIAVAVLGVWLRSRGTPRYGNMLLGLALALVHVDAWGAGPSLHVVSSGIALVIAAGASAALASLALALDEASLFAIGIGGAFVAPFVVSAGGGRLFVLLAYGLVVLASGAYVIRRREWPVAAGLMVLGCLVYVVAGTDLAAALSGWRAGYAPALFALCCTWCVALWGGAWQRRTVAAAYLTIALVAFVAAILTGHAPLAVVLGIPLGATLTAYALARLAQMRGPGRAVLAAAVPLGFLGAAVWAMHAAGDGSRALVAAFWTVLATGAAWDAVPDVRPLHVMVAGLAS